MVCTHKGLNMHDMGGLLQGIQSKVVLEGNFCNDWVRAAASVVQMHRLKSVSSLTLVA